MNLTELIEIAVPVDGEAAEAVSELFNRYNGGTWEEDSETGEASGGGAVIEATGFDDFHRPIEGEYRVVVKTYVKPGRRGEEIRRQIEEGLWRLSLLYPIPEPTIRVVREEDWAHAWKKFYKPMRIGQRVLLVPAWEEIETAPDDIVVKLEPGMAFGTGMHPTTRLCIAALEELVRPGQSLLDVGTGSGVLAVVGAKLGASPIVATDIDTLAIDATLDNAERNGIPTGEDGILTVIHGSIPADRTGIFSIVVANILAEILVGLFDGRYGNVPLAEPVAPGGTMILSGILDEKAGMVLEAAARHGFTLIDRKQESDWLALVVKKNE
ncbi:MAG: 50S ribosomal protein L11 methyltransferase [Caldilineaceae bacterium]|nr:50S ribosomal protein L11 methyltransferase [Caldilineaceae bacterium]